MRAVSYPDYGVMPEVTDVAEPACPDDGVVISVGATGVCRSDWHAWKGHDPVPLPHIPGHELAGTIAQTGPAVTRWRAGDRVTVPFACGCGRCDYCREGDTQVCPDQTQPGFTGPGSFAERVAIHAADTNLVALPDAVDFVTAASLGCRFATAYRALTGHAQLRPGEWLAVHGCGGVGLSAVHIGAALGARVIGVDVAGPALDRARELGAEHAILSATNTDPASVIRDITGGGAPVLLDALGSPETLAQFGALVAPPRAACPGRPAPGPRGHAARPDGPGHRAGAGNLRLTRDGGPGLPGHAGPDHRRHTPSRAAGRHRDRAGPHGAALAAMDGPGAAAGMTVIEL